MTFDLIREILGFVIGLLYLWWEYHANPKVWLAALVMPAISMWIYYSKGLYADFAINIYYLLIAVYGFIVWTRGGEKKDKPKKRITRITMAQLAGCSLVSVALWVLIWWILITFTDSTVPVADAFTTALSIVGLWMMAQKIAEQWLVWLVVDIVCTGLYFYKDIPFYAILYFIYSVVSVVGYRKWLQIMKGAD
ncbi:MAG: nicotinamide riboside transporter PnuC [Muribaculaceae bacterium]|nr:nicotinamide riboside transporter PnuC [Muribaculaceae bacterium]